MFTDPQSVTYNGSGLTLPRQSASDESSKYGTADGQFELSIERSVRYNAYGQRILRREVRLSRNVPDPTVPDYNQVLFPTNSVSLVYECDEFHTETSTDIPRLRTALLALVDTTFQSRILGNEL